MKYLRKREDYLDSINKAKVINEIYRKEEKLRLITEEAPFENDISFGDSYLGRLVNSVIRKAKIGTRIVKIDSCIRRLKDTFDDIILSSVIGDISTEDKQTLARIMSASYFRAIQKAVDDYVKGEGSLDEIKNLVKSTIDYLDKDKQAENMPDRREIIRQLEEFLKFLNPLKDEDEEKEKDKKDDEENKNKRKELYNKVTGLFSKNFTSVARLYLMFAEIKKLNSQKYSSGQQQQYGKKLKQFQKEDRKKKVAEEIAKRKEAAEISGQEKGSIREGFKIKSFESFYEFIREADAVTPPESKSPVLSELSKLYKSISSRGEKETSDIMQSILKGDSLKSSEGTLSSLKRIYEQIRIKMGLSVNKLNESNTETFMSENERSLQERILSLYNVTKSNPKIPDNLIENKNILQKINEEILKFRSSMEECLSKDLYGSSEDKEESTTEYLRYKRFDKIFEADEEEDTKTKVSKYWNEKIDLNKYAVSDSEVEKIKSEVDKKIATKKDSIEIQGMDPIIEIVKIFNRAYKLHTTQVIESGRSEGRVSNSVFLEYTSFGSGKPDSAGEGGGPYRHNATFDKWESAVLDIMGKKEYQRIFNVGTVVKVGSEYVEKAGSNLRKFMTDLLDGEELYKGSDRSGGPGAQSKFLDKYFGYKDGTNSTLSYSDGNEPDLQTNNTTSSGIKTPKLELKTLPYKEEKDSFKGSIFELICNEINQDPITYYCLVQDEDKDFYYITFSRTGKYILSALTNSEKTSVSTPSKFKNDEKDANGNNFKIFATKIKRNKLFEKGEVKFPSNFELSMVQYETKDGKVDNKSGSKELVNSKSLRLRSLKVAVNVESDDNKKHKMFKVKEMSIKDMLKKHGGFSEIKRDVESYRAEIK